MKVKEIKEQIQENEEQVKGLMTEDDAEALKNLDKKIVRSERSLRNFQRLVLYVFIIFTIIWLLFTCAIGLTSAPNEDMRPAFHGGDIVIYDKLNHNPGINDVIVLEKKGTTYLGRVVARGGDKVEVLEKGGILINDAAYVENYIYEGTYPYTTVTYPLTLSEDEYFVLVDSRANGEDSRYFGPVARKNIKGIVAWEMRRMGF